MRKNLYIGVITAEKVHGNDAGLCVDVVTIFAVSVHEALGLAMEVCGKTYQSEEYRNCRVSAVAMIPENTIRMAYNEIFKM
jgi:hypothetical protein